jgi:hypothetical protein
MTIALSDNPLGAVRFWGISRVPDNTLLGNLGLLEGSFVLVIEFAELGTLDDVLADAKSNPLSWAQKVSMAEFISIGLNAMHKHRLVHGYVNITL